MLEFAIHTAGFGNCPFVSAANQPADLARLVCTLLMTAAAGVVLLRFRGFSDGAGSDALNICAFFAEISASGKKNGEDR
jgi:hypothetical protein